MKPSEAQQHLELYRHGIDDFYPPVRAALDLAENDPILQSQIKENEHFDQRVRNALCNGCILPAGLKESILQGCREQTEDRRRILPMWSRIAALFLVAAIVTLIYVKPGTPATAGQLASIASIGDLELFATRYINTQADTQLNSVRSVNEIRQYLISQNSPEPQLLIKPIEGAEKYACGSIEYNGQKISLVQFLEKHSGTPCHLFIGSLQEFPEIPRNVRLELKECGVGSAALWSCSQRVYIMIFNAPKKELDLVMGR